MKKKLKKHKFLVLIFIVVIIVFFTTIIIYVDYKIYKNNEHKVEIFHLQYKYPYPNYIVKRKTIKKMNDDIKTSINNTISNDNLELMQYYFEQWYSEVNTLKKTISNKDIQIDSTKDLYNLLLDNSDDKEEKNSSCEPTYIKRILLVNKQHCLPASYNPNGLTKRTQKAFDKMQEDAKKDGVSIVLQSGYRSYDYQVNTYNQWKSLYGKKEADKISARPGYSEHQTGMAIDINGKHGCTLNVCFANTPEGEWIKQNAYKYGFIIRYPKNEKNITGYDYEPWHLRYVGLFPALKMHESDQTLEEYLGLVDQEHY